MTNSEAISIIDGNGMTIDPVMKVDKNSCKIIKRLIIDIMETRTINSPSFYISRPYLSYLG